VSGGVCAYSPLGSRDQVSNHAANSIWINSQHVHFFQFLDRICRELVANLIHTADATQFSSAVKSRRRRRCVFGIKFKRVLPTFPNNVFLLFVFINAGRRRTFQHLFAATYTVQPEQQDFYKNNTDLILHLYKVVQKISHQAFVITSSNIDRF